MFNWCRDIVKYIRVSCIWILHIHKRHLRIVTHHLFSLNDRNCLSLFGLTPINIWNVICNSASDNWNLRLGTVSIDLSYSHHSATLCRDLINWMKRINNSFRRPFIWIYVFGIEHKVRPIFEHVLLHFTWLCPLNPISMHVVIASLNVFKWTIHVRFDSWDITNIKFIYHKSLWSS